VRELERKCAAGRDVLQKLKNEYAEEKARADREMEDLSTRSKELDAKKAQLTTELKELQNAKKHIAKQAGQN
jgi:predicted  nucleic acid-binding Zn-ribbon protein